MKYELIPLGELGEIISGSTPDTTNHAYWGGDIPWITPADLTDHEGVYFTGNLRQITESGYKSCSTKMLPAGSILFSSRAPIGHCAVSSFPLCTNQGFKSIIPNERLNSIYGFFALKFFTPQIEALGRGATFTEVNKEIFENFRIPIPPLPEQQRIAAILQKADRLRRLRRYARQLSDTYLQSVFLEMFGDPILNPKGWDYITLGEKTKFLTSGSRGWAEYYSKDGDYFLRIQNIGKGKLLLDDLARVHAPESAESRRTQVQSRDLLLSITADLGRTAVIPNNFPKTFINQHLALIRLEGVNPVFVSRYISTPGGQKLVQQLDKAGVKSGLNFDDVNSLKVFLPPDKLQHKYECIVNQYEGYERRQAESSRQAEHLFQSLMQRAFQGEL